MSRASRMSALAGIVAVLGACTGDVIVQAQLEGDAGPYALRDLPVRALPYDRDVVFDSLRAAFPRPEPEIPDTLLALQSQIAAASLEEQAATQRWNAVRDSLRVVSEQLQRLSRASPQYRVLFQDFSALENQERDAQRRMNQAFQRLQELQSRFTTQATEVRLLREQWADEAYRDVDEVLALRLRASGRELAADTTDGNGVARFRLRTGQWWIHARYDLPFEELYWNVPVNVERGDPIIIQLNRSTAEVRPKI
jgi:hypothetical protein